MKQASSKLHKMMIGMLLSACLAIPLTLCAQQKEMPITTASAEAKKLFLEGRDRYELLEYPAAVRYFDQAIAKDPNFALAYLYRFLTGIGGTKAAQDHLAKAASLADHASPGERYLILYYKAQADAEGPKRKEYLGKLLDTFPSDKRVQYLAGQYYQYVERDFKTALQYYRGVTELDKNYAPVYDNIAFAHSALENVEEAEKAFRSEISLVPERPNPRDSFGWFLLRHGRYDESIEQYKAAFAQDSTFTGALAGLGDSYLLKGDHKQARECYESAIERAAGLTGYGGKLNTLDRIASSYVLEGRVEDALSTYKRYRSLAEKANQIEEIITSYQNEGFILTETGNPGEGLRRYQMAAEVLRQPNTPEAVKKTRTLQSMFGECYALLANNEVEAALAKMEESRRMAEERKTPNDARWMSFLNGLVESKNGNYARAQQHYSSSWPDIPIIKYYVAVTYEKMGEKEKTTELYKELENTHSNDLGIALVRHHMKKMAAK